MAVHTGVIPGAEAKKLYSYPALPTGADSIRAGKLLLGNGTWADAANVTVGTASNLSMNVHVDGIAFDGTSDINHYVMCSTKSTETVKKITLDGFKSGKGAFLFLQMIYDHTGTEAPQLQINSNDAVAIKDMFGEDITPSRFVKGFYILLRSNAYTHWLIMKGPNGYETCASAEAPGLMSADDKAKLDGIGEAAVDAPGLMSVSDKVKLDGIDVNANNYTHPSYTARTGVPTANQAPGFGGTFTVNQVNCNGTGHVTAVTSRTITIPSALATRTAPGLMSADDKTKLDNIDNEAAVDAPGLMSVSDKVKLDGIAAGANNYTHPSYTARTGATGNMTPGFGGNVTIPSYASDATGHVTTMTNRRLTIPNSAVSSSASGLMTAAMLASLQTAAADIAALKTAIAAGCTATLTAAGNLQFNLGTYKTNFLTIEKAGDY